MQALIDSPFPSDADKKIIKCILDASPLNDFVVNTQLSERISALKQKVYKRNHELRGIR